METFLTKAMNKLNPTKEKKDTIISEAKTEKENKKSGEKTVVPTNKAKLMYKQQTLASISNKGVKENG